jgi:hypothetical protein
MNENQTHEPTARKASNPTEASKRIDWQGLADRVREDAAGRKALADWAEKHRAAGAQRDEEQARRDRNAGITPEMIQNEHETVDEPASDEESASGEDDREPWEIAAEEQQRQAERAEDESGLSRFRVAKPIALEVPKDVHHIDESMVDEFGHVAVRENFSPEFAQALVGVVAEGIKGEKLDDPERTVSQLRFEFGDQADTLMREVSAFVAKRPALAAFLDESLTGNSVSTIKLLAAAAREPALLTKAGAERFIAGLRDNKKYAAGDKLEIAKARLAFTVAG